MSARLAKLLLQRVGGLVELDYIFTRFIPRISRVVSGEPPLATRRSALLNTGVFLLFCALALPASFSGPFIEDREPVPDGRASQLLDPKARDRAFLHSA